VEIGQHIDALEREGERLLEAAEEAGLSAKVPSCPGWQVRDLVAHIGFVHRWAARYISEGRTEKVPEPDEASILSSAPPEAELLPWARQGHQGLVRALRQAPSELQCWTFLPSPTPLAHWARRQAHETAVHRADAELAAGEAPGPFEPAFAADGVDELLFAFLARSRRRVSQEGEAVLGTMSFEPSDFDKAWAVEVLENHLAPLEGRAEADLTVRGSASELYLLAWNRLPAAHFEVEGRADLLGTWAERVRVSWS
jgi:uncharacterized protein (TIGR03083 family)